MKCRLKSNQLLDTTNTYKIDEVLVSRQKRKEQIAQRQIQEKASLINSKIIYLAREEDDDENIKPTKNNKTDGEIRRKKKDDKDMNGYLSIPEVSRNKVDFIR